MFAQCSKSANLLSTFLEKFRENIVFTYKRNYKIVDFTKYFSVRVNFSVFHSVGFQSHFQNGPNVKGSHNPSKTPNSKLNFAV